MMAGTHLPAPTLFVDDDLARGIAGDRKVPVPMLPHEIVSVSTASYYARVCEHTIRAWAAEDGIGRQSAKHAPLQVSFPAVLMRADGQMETLERFRQGQRHHPSVDFYIRRADELPRAEAEVREAKRNAKKSA